MAKVYIVSAKRIANGKFQGTLSDTHPSVYASELVKQILEETKIDSKMIDEVVIGNNLVEKINAPILNLWEKKT